MIEGNTAAQTEVGWQIDRILIVTGLDGTYAGYFKNLAATQQAGVPIIGSPHPALATAILRNISVVSMSSEEVKLRLFYSEDFFGFQNISAGATVTQVETNQGYLIIGDTPATTKTDITADKVDSLFAVLDSTGVLVSKFTPELTNSFTIVHFVTNDTINAWAKAFVGKTNTAGWTNNPLDAARTWLCTGITGNSIDNGISYTVTYSFQYKEDKWDTEVIYLNPETGRPYKPVDGTDEDPHSVIKKYKIHETIDFNLLGLS